MSIWVSESIAEGYRKAMGLKPGEYAVLEELRRAAGPAPSLEEIKRWLQAAVEADPHFAEAHFLMGWNRLEGGDFDGAAVSFSAAATCALRLRPDPRDAPLMVRTLEAQGMALERAGSLDEARRAYSKAASVYPAWTPSFVGLGRIAAHQNDPGAAARYFLESLRSMYFVSSWPKMPELARLGEELRSARDDAKRLGRRTLA